LAIDHLERRGTQGRLVGRVVEKFGPGEPLQPGSRPVVGQATKINGDDLVRDFGLVVRLWVEHRAGAELGVGEAEQFPPQRAGEDRIMVVHHRRQHAMDTIVSKNALATVVAEYG
jgi:hypothetical protein